MVMMMMTMMLIFCTLKSFCHLQLNLGYKLPRFEAIDTKTQQKSLLQACKSQGHQSANDLLIRENDSQSRQHIVITVRAVPTNVDLPLEFKTHQEGSVGKICNNFGGKLVKMSFTTVNRSLDYQLFYINILNHMLKLNVC